MQMVKWFSEQGLVTERTGPADIKGVDVTCCRINSGLREFQSWVLRLQAEHTLAPGILCFLVQRFFCFSPFPTLILSSVLSVSLLLNSGLQGDILTVIRRVDEHWIEAKLGEKVGVCPLQFTEVSSLFFSSFFHWLNVACGLSRVLKVDTCCLMAWLLSVMNWTIDAINSRSLPGHYLEFHSNLWFIHKCHSCVAQCWSRALICGTLLCLQLLINMWLCGLLGFAELVICLPLYFIHAGGKLYVFLVKRGYCGAHSVLVYLPHLSSLLLVSPHILLLFLLPSYASFCLPSTHVFS